MEKDIEKAVVEYARKRGALVYKFTAPGVRNVPDRLFLCRGQGFFIEFKAPGKIASAGQLREASKIQQQGFDVYVVDNVERGRTIVDSYT